MSYQWTIQHLEGPADRRMNLILSGYSAPFGRPRRDPIFTESIKSRIQTTRYPGSSSQTRHAFGTNWEAMEMKGRWSTRNLLAAGHSQRAGDVVDDWIRFIREERTCRISWGPIVSWTGYLEELHLGRESEDEVAWKMKFQVDQRDDTPRAKPLVVRPIKDDIAFLQSWVATADIRKSPVENDLSPDFLQSLDNLAAELNKPAALMAKLAGDLDDIEKKTFSTLQHFRGAVSNMRTAIAHMQETIDNVEIDSAILVRSAKSDLAWVTYQSNFDTGATDALDFLNNMDRVAQLQQRYQVERFITAREGDSWESISTRVTGSPQKAGDIRALNGIRYGEKPVPGESYFVQVQ